MQGPCASFNFHFERIPFPANREVVKRRHADERRRPPTISCSIAQVEHVADEIDIIGYFAILPDEVIALCTDGSLTSTFKLASTNKGLKLKLQNALQDTPLRILTSCHKRAIDAHYKSGFTVGEVVWRPFGDWEFPLTTNQMNRMFCFLPALHTIWLTPEPVKCATGVLQCSRVRHMWHTSRMPLLPSMGSSHGWWSRSSAFT